MHRVGTLGICNERATQCRNYRYPLARPFTCGECDSSLHSIWRCREIIIHSICPAVQSEFRGLQLDTSLIVATILQEQISPRGKQEGESSVESNIPDS